MRFLIALTFLLACVASAAAQKPSTGTLVGKEPYFKLNTIHGKPLNTQDLRGKYVVYNLWFVGCPNCVEEIGMLNAIVDQYKSNNDVAFVSLASSPAAEVKKFLEKHPFKYQTVPDAAMIIISQFGVPNKQGDINVPFPMHIIVDPYGKVITEAQGIKGVAVVKSVLASKLGSK